MGATPTLGAVKTNDATLKYLGYEQITGLTTVKALALPAGCNYAVIHAEDKAVRWRADGTDPTASVGSPIPAGGNIPLAMDALAEVRLIETEASATVSVDYYYAG